MLIFNVLHQNSGGLYIIKVVFNQGSTIINMHVNVVHVLHFKNNSLQS